MTLLPSSPDVFCRSGSHTALCKVTGGVLAALVGDPPEGGLHMSLQCSHPLDSTAWSSSSDLYGNTNECKVKRCRGDRRLEKYREHLGCLSCITTPAPVASPKKMKTLKVRTALSNAVIAY